MELVTSAEDKMSGRWEMERPELLQADVSDRSETRDSGGVE